MKKLTQKLLYEAYFCALSLFILLNNVSAQTCDTGYYYVITDSTNNVGLCQICPAGKFSKYFHTSYK
jgi:hypothetical protein